MLEGPDLCFCLGGCEVPWRWRERDEIGGFQCLLLSVLFQCLSSQDISYGAACSLSTSLGQLFLLLQYQALANRIKVLVRKAENLGRLTRMPGAPGRERLQSWGGEQVQ